MQKSESITEITKALVNFHSKVEKIKKENVNPFFKSKYASLPAILDVVEKPLLECGLNIMQFPSNCNGLTTILSHTSGEWIMGEYIMNPIKDDPQGRGSSITYQRRYAIGAILSLNIDEDDDGNNASGLVDSIPTKQKITPPQEKNADSDKIWLNKLAADKTTITEDWKNAVNYVTCGINGKKGTVADLRKRYKISQTLAAELQDKIEEYNMINQVPDNENIEYIPADIYDITNDNLPY